MTNVASPLQKTDEQTDKQTSVLKRSTVLLAPSFKVVKPEMRNRFPKDNLNDNFNGPTVPTLFPTRAYCSKDNLNGEADSQTYFPRTEIL